MGDLIFDIQSFDALDSTNDHAKELVWKDEAKHGTVIWAKQQAHGRGRAGREWIGLEDNLFCSLIIQSDKSMQDNAQLTFLASLATAGMLHSLVPDTLPVSLKWPNDVLLNEKKVAGILLESYPGKKAGEHWVIIGIGVNVMQAPAGTVFPATSIAEVGLDIISAKIVLARLIHHFSRIYHVWEEEHMEVLQALWLKQAYRLSEEMSVTTTEGEVLTGIFTGLDETGALILEMSDGTVLAIPSAEVVPAVQRKAEG